MHSTQACRSPHTSLEWSLKTNRESTYSGVYCTKVHGTKFWTFSSTLQGTLKNPQMFKKERKIIYHSSLALRGATPFMIAHTNYGMYLNLNSLELWYYATELLLAGYLKNAQLQYLPSPFGKFYSISCYLHFHFSYSRKLYLFWWLCSINIYA